MTEEEVNEYNQLLDKYNRLVAENSELAAEIEVGIDNCYIVANNISNVGETVTGNVKYVSGEVSDAREVVDKLYRCLIDLTEHYFLFKNLSEASKMLTKYNDEYYTKYKFYNELRRITLGYVIGLDAHVVSSESLRKKVEKAYLANTDYWLAYAITAVMLWASDEKEAAYRAMNRSMTMDCYKSCVFFMLVNLRFGRLDAARNWYITLLDKTDVNNMSPEWQHVLRAYLIGAMSNDPEFTDMASRYFAQMIDQTEATNADFNKKVADRARAFAQNFIHLTDNEFVTLKEVCPEYPEMKKLLSSMEKIGVLAQYYDGIYQMEEDEADDMFGQIENVLYDLINGYDEKEFEIVKQIKRNEAILAAKGNMSVADAKFQERYGDLGKNKTFADLMLKWAFDEDYRETDITVKRFSLSYLKERISKGIAGYFEEQKRLLKDRYTLVLDASGSIPGCELTTDEHGYESAAETVTAHYNKQKFRYIMADSQFKIFLLLCGGALLLLAIAAMTIGSQAFPVLLTLGITLGVVSGFLVWRRCVDLGKELAERCRLTLVKLRNALDEMGTWRKLVNKEYEAIEDLQNAVDRF